MMAERLAEIRKEFDERIYGGKTASVIRELTDHIAQLEAREIEARNAAIIAQESQRKAWIERSQMFLRMEAAEAQRGGAVVVPEPTVKQWIKEVLDAAYNDPEPHATMRAATKWFRENSRTIPADRVLADGMVGVDRKVLTDLREGLQNILDEIPNGEDQGEGYTDPVEIQCWKIREAKSALDALRAQQAKRE